MKHIVLLVIIFTSQTVFSQFNMSRYLTLARNEIYFKNYAESIERANTVIKSKPYLAEPYLYRGIAKFNLGDYEGAEKDFTQVLYLKPFVIEAWLYRGTIKLRKKEYKQALEDFNEGLKNNSKNENLLLSKVIALLELDELATAKSIIQKQVNINNKNYEAYYYLGVVKEQLGNNEEALQAFSKAVELNPLYGDAIFGMGVMQYHLGKYDKALESFEKVLLITPNNTKVHNIRALVYIKQLQYENALKDYARMIELEVNNPLAYFNRALLYQELGDTKNALDNFNKVATLDSDNILTYFNRGLLKIKIGDNYGAIDDFTKALTIFSYFTKALEARAIAKEKVNDILGAASDREEAVKKLAELKIKRRSKYFASIDTATNLQRYIEFDFANYGVDKEKAIKEGQIQYKEVVVKLEENFSVLYKLKKDSMKNTIHFSKIIEDFNDKYDTHYLFFISNKREKIAEDTLNFLIHKTKKNTDSTTIKYLKLALLHGYKKNYSEAITYYDKILAINPIMPLALLNKANIIMEMNEYINSFNTQIDKEVTIDYSEALNISTKLIDNVSTKDFYFAYFNHANILSKSKKFNESLLYYTFAINTNPDFAEAYYNRGVVLIHLNQKQKAAVNLGKAAELGILKAYSVLNKYCN